MPSKKFDLKKSLKLKKKHGGHGWLCPDGTFESCESESRILHPTGIGSGLWGHERVAVELLERRYPKLLDALEKEIEAAGYESFDDTNGHDVVRKFMVRQGFQEV